MRRVFFGLILAGLSLSCGSEPSENLSRCGTSGEFANSGCAEVTGFVTLANGAAARGAFVDVAAPVQTNWYLVGAARASASGHYQLRIIRLSGEVPTGGPDTGTVWVRAALPPPLGSPDEPSLRDSIQATVEIRPVDTAPIVVQAETLIVRAP